MAIFNSYVSLPEGTWWFFNELGVFVNGLDHQQMVGSMGSMIDLQIWGSTVP